jgi:multidrug efflux system membrane fusion protein
MTYRQLGSLVPHRSSRLFSKGRLIGSLVLLALVGITVWRIRAEEHSGKPKTDAPLVVATAAVRQATVPIELRATGEVVSRHSVSVMPQVSGLLQSVGFHEGQMVARGQLLFRIDPAPFQAALASARSAWNLDESIVRRDSALLPHGYIAPEAYETAVATAQQAKAALRQARINLSYTVIRAPIAGLTGAISVRSGNLVSSSMTTPLVTINQMAPILVEFNLPQSDLETVLHYRDQGPVGIEVSREGGGQVLGSGPLVFIDNTVNSQTGTVLYRARLPNHPLRLWPGQYVGVRVVLSVQKNALVVPQTAVQDGQKGYFVYEVVNGRAVIVPVTVAHEAGGLAVIRTGLPLGATVVTEVPETLRNNMRVMPRNRLPVVPKRRLT